MKNHNLNHYYKLSILDGLELLSATNHTTSFPFHTHNTFNITLVLKQTFNTKLTDKFLQAPANSLFITNPNEVHATPCDSKTGNSFFTFYISPEVLKKLNKNTPVFFEDKVVYDEQLVRSLYVLSQNFTNSGLDVESKLVKVLEILVADYASKNSFTHKEITLFNTFINDDSLAKFSLDETAKYFGLDKYKFLRLFKQETGLTPHNYTILKRVETCKKLLIANGDLLDIATKAGFYDTAHFCKHFKRFTGVTPLEYRNA